jgi:hypothetical protein
MDCACTDANAESHADAGSYAVSADQSAYRVAIANTMSAKLEGPFSIRLTRSGFWSSSPDYWEIVDMNGLSVGVAPSHQWNEANRLCLEYNKAFCASVKDKESWEE